MPSVRDFPTAPAGTVIRLPHRSRALEGNPWNDPVERELPVYLPAGYSESGDPHIALWDLAAFTNSGHGHLNWRGHGENLVQRLDRLIHAGDLPPVVVPMPDCYTSLGGNQYINSAAVGAYADYVVGELLPLLEKQVNVGSGRGYRGAFGKSSGGYGALVYAMLYPETWGAVAAHAPDCGFETVYRADFPNACRVLAEFDGDPARFLRAFWNKKRPAKQDYLALMTVAMAASYDANPEHPGRIRLPVDLHTCTLDEDRWSAWLRHDPLHLVEPHAQALQSLHCLHLDVGSRDQFNIQFGVRALAAKLEELGIDHHFEEFDGTHSGLDWRLDLSLPRLARALLSSRDH